jgi:hypothetical protein
MKKTKHKKKTNKKDTHQAGKKGGKTTPISSYEEYLEAYYLGEPIDDAKEKE